MLPVLLDNLVQRSLGGCRPWGCKELNRIESHPILTEAECSFWFFWLDSCLSFLCHLCYLSSRHVVYEQGPIFHPQARPAAKTVPIVRCI